MICMLSIDNTNVDRSLATIHAIVIKCLRNHYKGKSLWDPIHKQVLPLTESEREREPHTHTHTHTHTHKESERQTDRQTDSLSL